MSPITARRTSALQAEGAERQRALAALRFDRIHYLSRVSTGLIGGVCLTVAFAVLALPRVAQPQSSEAAIYSNGFESGSLCGWSGAAPLADLVSASLSLQPGQAGAQIEVLGTELMDPNHEVFLRGPRPTSTHEVPLTVVDRQAERLRAQLDEALQPGAYDVVLDTCFGQFSLNEAVATPTFTPGFAAPDGRVVVRGMSFGAQPGSVRLESSDGALDASVLLWQDDEVVFAVHPAQSGTGHRSVRIGNQHSSLTVLDGLSILEGVVDEDGPRLVSAVATSSTTVLAQFNEAVLGGSSGAEEPSLYRITAPVRTPSVEVISAQLLPPDYSTVLLTTLSQTDLTYELQVAGIHDLAGNPLASPADFRIDPTRTSFVGIAPSGADRTDYDGDGLTDQAEQLGWTVNIVSADGSITSTNVTSDPLLVDTDGDELTDLEEAILRINPRSGDSDRDGLGDFQEFSEIYSDPGVADTDGDGIQDGSEFSFFGTSPLLQDTDGDQLPDGDEVVLQSRNARVADLPRPTIEVGDVDLQLDVRFIATSSQGSRELESRSIAKTLSQSEERSYSNTFSTTQSVTASLAVKQGWAFSTEKIGVEGSVEFAVGYAGEWTSSFTNASSQSAQQEVARSFSTDAEVSESETVQREIAGASMRVPVTLKALGGIAFTMSNIEISALIQDPRDPAELRPIATLLPESGGDLTVNLGPFNRERGPFVFKSVETFPSLVQDLLIAPRGLIFRVANFDITDEAGRNFAFTSQEINERTAPLVIDFGGADQDNDGEGDGTERYFVATSGGRIAVDTDGDGHVDANDRPVVFDRQGRAVGIDLVKALGDILGLDHKNEDVVGEATTDLTQGELTNSFSTRSMDFTTDQPCTPGSSATCVEQLWRVRLVSKELGNPLRDWVVLTPTGIDYSTDFGSRLLEPGSAVDLAFVQDLDGDRVPARWEFQGGCSDLQSDTDGDGLLDRFEIFGALRDGDGNVVPEHLGGDPLWNVDLVGGGNYEAFASCRSTDSDVDGIDDLDELDRCVDGSGAMVRCCARPNPLGPCAALDSGLVRRSTDPKSSDSDNDGVSDRDEDRGYTIELRFPRSPSSRCSPGLGLDEVICKTDPLNRDGDGDTLSDGDEVRLGLDPTVDDGGDVLDQDGDGLVKREEIDGWPVTYFKKSGVARQQGTRVDCAPASSLPTTGDCATDAGARLGSGWSYELDQDTDGDGLNDAEEMQRGTHPRRADTDGDGISDLEEVIPGADGFETDPLDADSDDDLRSDGEETSTPLVITLPGETRNILTSPVNADEDGDQLVDGEEATFGTDPTDQDTDGDGVTDKRETESRAGLMSNPLVADQIVTFAITQIEVKAQCEDSVGFEAHAGNPEPCATWRLRNPAGGQDVLGMFGDWNGSPRDCPTRAPGVVQPGPAWSASYIMKPGESVVLNTVDSWEYDPGLSPDIVCEIGESSTACPLSTGPENEFTYPVTSTLKVFGQTCIGVANALPQSGELLGTTLSVTVEQ